MLSFPSVISLLTHALRWKHQFLYYLPELCYRLVLCWKNSKKWFFLCSCCEFLTSRHGLWRLVGWLAGWLVGRIIALGCLDPRPEKLCCGVPSPLLGESGTELKELRQCLGFLPFSLFYHEVFCLLTKQGVHCFRHRQGSGLSLYLFLQSFPAPWQAQIYSSLNYNVAVNTTSMLSFLCCRILDFGPVTSIGSPLPPLWGKKQLM